LVEILEEGQQRGLLGPRPVRTHIEHARGFASALRLVAPHSTPPPRALDLGAGGGIPGAVLLFEWPTTEFVWLDAAERSTEFLSLVVERLGVSSRVAVVRERAEDVGRAEGMRGSFDVVVARSFGRPAMTAECAAPFLLLGGHLVVSEPPGTVEGRWNADGLAGLGLELAGQASSPANFQVFRQVEVCLPEFPRRSGRPAKRPLF
jgi:16S rRNA (guanine527-N7)-methyltransferase